jgi:hypothetical protein
VILTTEGAPETNCIFRELGVKFPPIKSSRSESSERIFDTTQLDSSHEAIVTYDRVGLKFISQLQKLRFKNSLPSFLSAF